MCRAQLRSCLLMGWPAHLLLPRPHYGQPRWGPLISLIFAVRKPPSALTLDVSRRKKIAHQTIMCIRLAPSSGRTERHVRLLQKPGASQSRKQLKRNQHKDIWYPDMILMEAGWKHSPPFEDCCIIGNIKRKTETLRLFQSDMNASEQVKIEHAAAGTRSFKNTDLLHAAFTIFQQ